MVSFHSARIRQGGKKQLKLEIVFQSSQFYFETKQKKMDNKAPRKQTFAFASIKAP